MNRLFIFAAAFVFLGTLTSFGDDSPATQPATPPAAQPAGGFPESILGESRYAAEITRAKVDLSVLKTAPESFEIDNGRLPTSAEGLQALVANPANLPNWHAALTKLPVDLWGNPYIYHCPGPNGQDLDLYCSGLGDRAGDMARAKADVASLKTALVTFEVDNGRFPTTIEGLKALAANPAKLPDWKPLVDKVPLDPWGHPYIYRCPGTNGNDFDIYSTGPNGRDDHGGGQDISK